MNESSSDENIEIGNGFKGKIDQVDVESD